MNHFEEKLSASLQRKEPSEGFAERVMARLPKESRWKGWRPRRWLAAAALLLVTSSSLLYWQRERRMQAEGEQARAELVQALRISSEKLNQALEKVNHINEKREKS